MSSHDHLLYLCFYVSHSNFRFSVEERFKTKPPLSLHDNTIYFFRENKHGCLYKMKLKLT